MTTVPSERVTVEGAPLPDGSAAVLVGAGVDGGRVVVFGAVEVGGVAGVVKIAGEEPVVVGPDVVEFPWVVGRASIPGSSRLVQAEAVTETSTRTARADCRKGGRKEGWERVMRRGASE
ncbi:MAG: hypothetical protein VYC56_06120 [Actinomycetota bacterium]|nr:hypothetical protein [Actinomycetota bacterium]